MVKLLKSVSLILLQLLQPLNFWVKHEALQKLFLLTSCTAICVCRLHFTRHKIVKKLNSVVKQLITFKQCS